MPSRSRLAACLLAATFAASGCASLQSSDNLLGVITPYRVEVVQGNVVTQEQAALVKPGMTRAQVRDVLGSPLLTDALGVADIAMPATPERVWRVANKIA